MPNGDDKNWVRLCAAVNGFRSRYGVWPTRVRVFSDGIDNLRNDLFSEEAFSRLTSRLELVADGASIVAEDDSGRSYDYGKDGFPTGDPDIPAQQWLFHIPVRQ